MTPALTDDAWKMSQEFHKRLALSEYIGTPDGDNGQEKMKLMAFLEWH